MIREFIETSIFRQLWTEAKLSEEDLRTLQRTLLASPDAGVVIKGTHGLRKIRVPASGRGKRGGARVFYKDFAKADKIFFIFLIVKNESEDLLPEQKSRVAKMLKSIEEDLNG